MKKLTSLLVTLFVMLSSFSQTTHDINWKTNTLGDLTISQGDIVRWTWGDAFQHSVTSLSGPESFDSGLLVGMGTVFTHTFNSPGTTNYQCDVHSGTMTGAITVQILAIEDQEKQQLKIYPNPVLSKLNITGTQMISNVSITNLLGQNIYTKAVGGKELTIDMNNYHNGLYFIEIESDHKKSTYRIIKK